MEDEGGCCVNGSLGPPSLASAWRHDADHKQAAVALLKQTVHNDVHVTAS